MGCKQWAHELGIKTGTLQERLRSCPEHAFHVGHLPKSHLRAKLYEHDGKALTIEQWAKELGISVWTFRSRLYRYPDRAFHKGKLPVEVQSARPVKRFLYEGEMRTASEIAELTNWAVEAIHQAYRSGRTIVPKPRPKPILQLDRPYFTFSKGGSLKTPHHAVHAPQHHTGGGINKLSAITLRAARPHTKVIFTTKMQRKRSK